jgi:hypothetical protein
MTPTVPVGEGTAQLMSAEDVIETLARNDIVPDLGGEGF